MLLGATSSYATTIELLNNGGFETGDFSGWFAVTASDTEGTIEVISDSIAPLSGGNTTNPSEGSFHAITGQTGPGAYSISQGFAIPTDALSLTLTFDLFAVSNAGFADAGSFDFMGAPNQHARVDILSAGADPFDLDSVVMNVVAPLVSGDFANTMYTSYTIDLSDLVGVASSFVLNFGQVDNLSFFSTGIDNVSLTAETAVVPIPSALLLMLSGFASLALRFRKS